MAALAPESSVSAPPAPASASRGESRLRLRLIISIPVLLILVALAYGVVSYLSFSIFWDDLDKAGAGDMARNLLRIHMNALIMLAFASAVAGVILATTILRPIRALLEATRQVAGGNFDRHATSIPSMSELDDLSNSFNDMIDNINSSISERSRRLMDGIPIGVLSTDLGGHISAASPLAGELLGLPADQIIGLRVSELFDITPHPAHVLIDFLISQLGTDATHATAEVTLNDIKASKSLTVTSTQLKSGDGQPFGFMFCFREAARMRDLSDQLSRSDQLAALGTFTLGLAHELRNPLGAIKGFSQLLLMERDLPPRAGDFLARMVVEVDRVDGLVRQLFDLSEQPLACRIPCNLNKVLEQATETARQAVAPARLREIKLKLDLRPLPPFLLEHDRLVQAFAQVIQNAYEFTPDGGAITLRTRQGATPAGPVLRVEVRNTGSVIPPEDRRKVFEPFFTTKPKATGLGLTIAGQIVTQNGGRLQADMEEGEVVFTAAFQPSAPLAEPAQPVMENGDVTL